MKVKIILGTRREEGESEKVEMYLTKEELGLEVPLEVERSVPGVDALGIVVSGYNVGEPFNGDDSGDEEHREKIERFFRRGIE